MSWSGNVNTNVLISEMIKSVESFDISAFAELQTRQCPRAVSSFYSENHQTLDMSESYLCIFVDF